MKTKKFQYLRAGINASQEIKDAIEDFHEEPYAVKRDTPLLYYLLGSGTPPYKMSREDAAYKVYSGPLAWIYQKLNALIGLFVKQTNKIKNKKCGNCVFAYMQPVTGKIICSQIEGNIKFEDTCRLWKGI